MKESDNLIITIRQSIEFRRSYLFACIGFSLIGVTYLLRELFSGREEVLAIILGIMPSLAGSFATPFILLVLVAIQTKNQAFLMNTQIFLLINLFVFSMCVLIEFLHLWLNLGGFHWNDIGASIAGMFMALLSFQFVVGKKQSEPS